MGIFKKAFMTTCPLCKAIPEAYCTHVQGWRKGQTCSTVHNERIRAAGGGCMKESA